MDVTRDFFRTDVPWRRRPLRKRTRPLQALLSRQANAEASVNPSCNSDNSLKGTEERQPEDDEALLLSGLMNEPQRAGQWVLRQNVAAHQHVTSPPTCAEPGQGTQGPASDAPDQQRVAPSIGSTASHEFAGGSPCSPALHSFDYANEDTVLTGSPVGSPYSSRMSSVSEPMAQGAGRETEEAEETLEPPGSALAPASQPMASSQRMATKPASPEVSETVVVASDTGNACTGQAQALTRTGTPSPGPLIHTPQPSCMAGREAVRQRQWSFADIPQGTAIIPSKGGNASLAAWGARVAGTNTAMQGPRPAFYVRAASPPSRLLGIPPAKSGTPAASSSRRAGSTAGESRRERLARLAQPKHAGPHRHAQLQRQRLQRREHASTRAPGSAASPDQLAALSDGSKAGQLGTATATLPAAGDRIAAWRPDAKETSGVRPLQPPPAQPQQAQRGSSSSTRGCASEPAASCGPGWPERLGQDLGAAELQTATGAYSEERFQLNLRQLSARLAARQAARQQEADAAAAGGSQMAALCVLRMIIGRSAPHARSLLQLSRSLLPCHVCRSGGASRSGAAARRRLCSGC